MADIRHMHWAPRGGMEDEGSNDKVVVTPAKNKAKVCRSRRSQLFWILLRYLASFLSITTTITILIGHPLQADFLAFGLQAEIITPEKTKNAQFRAAWAKHRDTWTRRLPLNGNGHVAISSPLKPLGMFCGTISVRSMSCPATHVHPPPSQTTPNSTRPPATNADFLAWPGAE